MKQSKNIRVAMIGNADSIWVVKFIENISKTFNHKVVLISQGNEKYAEKYDQLGVEVKVINGRESIFYKIPKLRGIVNTLKTLIYILKANADVVHVQYGHKNILKLISVFPFRQKIILTYWGSDILRENNSELLAVKGAVKKADSIVVMTKELKDKVRSVYGKAICKKTSVSDMGVSAFSEIDRLEQRKELVRNQFIGEVNKDKLVVTLGYNAAAGQQHLELIKHISSMSEEDKNRILLVVPMTYQVEYDGYVDKVECELNRANLNYIILRDFMNDEEIASLCISSDVFINAQITDALATSMIEQLYAQTYMLKGEWLKYSILDNMGVEYDSFANFEEMCEIIHNILKNGSKISEKNKELLSQGFSWDESRKRWEKIYNSVINR